MRNLQVAIEKLYSVFGRYTSADMYYCDCGCIKEADVKKLHSKPLRELREDDLSLYHGKALYTWGGEEHYKHFFPRFLELYSSKRNTALIDLYDIHVKLEYAKWTEWNIEEIEAIENFILQDWIEFVNHDIAEIRESDLANYGLFFNIKQLIKLWKITQSGEALNNFVVFFYYYGNRILDDGLKLDGIRYKDEFKHVLQDKMLLKKLENEFFKFESIDTEYAAKVSIVVQMIEQALTVQKNNF